MCIYIYKRRELLFSGVRSKECQEAEAQKTQHIAICEAFCDRWLTPQSDAYNARKQKLPSLVYIYTQGTRAYSRGSTLIRSHSDCNVINAHTPGWYSTAFLKARFQPRRSLSGKSTAVYYSLHRTIKYFFSSLYPNHIRCQPHLLIKCDYLV